MNDFAPARGVTNPSAFAASYVRTGRSQVRRPLPAASATILRVPPAWVEAGFYLVLFYAIFGQFLGSVPLLGAVTLAFLAATCLMRLSGRSLVVLRALTLPLACASAFIAVQVLVHGHSLLAGEVRPFVTWMIGLVLLQCLSLRPGFLRRFATCAIVLGVCLLPFITVREDASAVTRIGIEGAGLSNPNSLGMWFGFCAVYAIVSSIETRSIPGRVWWALVALGCLYVVGMTVSRGPLLGVAIAATVAFRRFLKRGFIPVLAVLICVWAVLASGVFDRVIESYVQRGSVETGRGQVWPAAIRRIADSPLAGVGASDVYTATPGRSWLIAPHNGVLYVALASGIAPALLFVAFWALAIRRTLRVNGRRPTTDPFVLPLMIFALLEMMILDTAFMSPWHLAVMTHLVWADMRVRRRAAVRIDRAMPFRMRQPYRGGAAAQSGLRS